MVKATESRQDYFLRKKPKRNGGGCVSVSGQLTVWETLGAERGWVALDLASEQEKINFSPAKKYTSKRTSSNEAMKSRAVHGSQVFEWGPCYDFLVWSDKQQRNNINNKKIDDVTLGRCQGIQPTLLSTSRMPHSSLWWKKNWFKAIEIFCK